MGLMDDIREQPWQGAVLGVVLGGFIVGGLYVFKIKEQKRVIEAKEKEVAKLQEEVEKGRAIKAELPAVEERLKTLEKELAKLIEIMPAEINMEFILRDLRAIATQGNLHILRLDVRDEISHDFYKEIPMEIAMQGTYHNLAVFFDKLSRFPRIINVDELRIGAFNQGGYTISATFRAKTFRYVPMEEGEEGVEEL